MTPERVDVTPEPAPRSGSKPERRESPRSGKRKSPRESQREAAHPMARGDASTPRSMCYKMKFKKRIDWLNKTFEYASLLLLLFLFSFIFAC